MCRCLEEGREAKSDERLVMILESSSGAASVGEWWSSARQNNHSALSAGYLIPLTQVLADHVTRPLCLGSPLSCPSPLYSIRYVFLSWFLLSLQDTNIHSSPHLPVPHAHTPADTCSYISSCSLYVTYTLPSFPPKHTCTYLPAHFYHPPRHTDAYR